MTDKQLRAKIERLQRQYAHVEERIGVLMTLRADIADELAAAYREWAYKDER